MLVQSDFEESVTKFSLRFKDPSVEQAYVTNRAELKTLSKSAKCLLLVILIGYVFLSLIDIISVLSDNDQYTYNVNDWVIYSLSLIVVIGEPLCYFCKRLSICRGLLMTTIGGLVLFQNSFSTFESKMFYPYSGPETMLWGVTVVYMNMNYVQSWILSLVSYILVCIEITFLLFYYYGARFVGEEAPNGALDIVYYSFIFILFSGCSIYASRAYEIIERKNFYFHYQQVQDARMWKKLLGHLPEPIIFARKGSVSFFNAATLKMLGISQQEDSERTKADLMEKLGELRQKGSKRPLKEAIEKSLDIFADEPLFVYKKDNKKLSLTVKCVRPTNDNEDGVTEYIFHDITALKDLERNKTKEQCFSILLSTASHDIRTPLNLILGVIDVLADCINTPSGREQINVAQCCGQRMLYYLKGLDFIQQINKGKLEMQKRLFSPETIARSVVNTAEFSAVSKKIRLEFAVDPSVPSTMCSDCDMYVIILQNLLENSIKYTFAGGVKVSLKFDESGHKLLTTIADTGIGMNEKQLHGVGVLFKKPGIKSSMNPQGLGLGLFLAKTLSRQLDGDLSIESKASQGTTAQFAITSFMADESLSEGRLLRHRSTNLLSDVALSFSCECPKILLVDDEPFNLLVLSAYLASANIKADKAGNGKIALDLIKARSESSACCQGYSMIFMDINMPVMDGVEATTQIRELVKDGKIPPCYVMAVTAAAGLDRPSTYAEYVSKGFVELLSKPVHKNGFLNIIKKYMPRDSPSTGQNS